MTKPAKIDILKMLSAHLEAFFPHLHDYFMCPLCLTPIPLQEKSKISEAHIIPKAAGGTLKTYLCAGCNKILGAKQDKWFGDYMRLVSLKKPTIFATKIKQGSFLIEGVRANGRWEYDEKQGFSFTTIVQQNSPQTNEIVHGILSSRPSKFKIQVSFPLLKHEAMVHLGILTAGYLMWFGLFGYSWVFQSHLDPIRDQILNPDKKVPMTWAIFYSEEFRWNPWIGFALLQNEIVLAMGVRGFLVVFPTADQPQLTPELLNLSGSVQFYDAPLKLPPKPSYGPPLWVLFDKRFLIVPDAAMKESLPPILHRFFSGSCESKVLYPISSDKRDRLTKIPGTEVEHLDFKYTGTKQK